MWGLAWTPDWYRLISWIPYHLEDLESDFSAFHRVDDMYGLTAPRFFRLAVRLPAYQGVMRMRLEQEHARTRQRQDRSYDQALDDAYELPSSEAPADPVVAHAATGPSAMETAIETIPDRHTAEVRSRTRYRSRP